MCTIKLNPDVSPISVVVVSAKLRLLPFHIAVIFPARAFDAEVAV